MRVYRISNRVEVATILETENLSLIGRNFKNESKNNHNYLQEKRYVHFFKDEVSILYLSSRIKRYLCTYDIPEEILKKYEGIGYYMDHINFRNQEKVVEYAVPSDEIKFEYLLSIDEFNSFVDYFDYIELGSFETYKNSIYKKDKSMTKSVVKK